MQVGYGKTRNFGLLFSVPVGVLTVTTPVLAPLGTVVVKYVSETTVKVAATPAKETFVAPVKPCPNTPTGAPTPPVVGINYTDGFRPTTSKL